MVDRFREYIEKGKLFGEHDSLVLAVSGGVDSVVLVDLCRKAGYHFVIAHVNFNLREQESVRDEQFVTGLAAQAGVKLFTRSVDTKAFAADKNLSIQEAARILRYEWFEELRQQVSNESKNKKAWILTAHHLDDSVETMLMNLFRGTGLTGLRGIVTKHDHLVRPLLCFTKEEIVGYASANSLSWVEDSSNQLDKYTRNYFRNQLIPMIRKIYPQVDQNLYQNLDRFSDSVILYREALQRRLKKLVVHSGDEIHLPVARLATMEAAATVLFEILQPLNFSAAQSAEVLKLLEASTGNLVIGSTHRVLRNRKWLIIAPNNALEAKHVVIEKEDQLVRFGNHQIQLEQKLISEINLDENGIPLKTSPGIALLDADEISYPLLLRKWKTGDYFYPLGMKKKKKIARFLIDAKKSLIQKENTWVIESARRIAWVVGQRIDDRFRISGSTKRVLVLSETFNIVPDLRDK